ncbi:MAG: DNA-binding PadR family transcriptional regulator [Candidatus Azotimanducaceae bacterium]|jgi:DNA-binding PadR family transcriptional regulator
MALSQAIMTALLDQDLSGYDLAKQFDVSLGFFWSASHQQIYQQLKVLADAGHIEVTEVSQSGKPDKRVYGLTGIGRAALMNWVQGETRRKPARDDLFVKLYNLKEASPGLLVDQIDVRRTEHVGRLALYERIRVRGYDKPDGLSVDRQGKYLALLAGIYQEQAAIQWCDEALLILRSIAEE